MTLLNQHKIEEILRHCFKNPAGLLGEVGVFNGGFTSILLDNFLDTKIYAYDTFEGMAPGGAIFLDDWDWPNCPGVRRAVEELGLEAKETVQYQSVIYFK